MPVALRGNRQVVAGRGLPDQTTRLSVAVCWRQSPDWRVSRALAGAPRGLASRRRPLVLAPSPRRSDRRRPHQPGGDADPRLQFGGFDIEATDSVDRTEPG